MKYETLSNNAPRILCNLELAWHLGHTKRDPKTSHVQGGPERSRQSILTVFAVEVLQYKYLIAFQINPLTIDFYHTSKIKVMLWLSHTGPDFEKASKNRHFGRKSYVT